MRKYLLSFIVFSFSLNCAVAQWVSNGPAGTTVVSIATNGSNIFAGDQNGEGVLFSADNGLSWTPINNNLPNTNIFSLCISGINIFSSTQGGVFVSINNGSSWTAVSGLSGTFILSFAVSGSTIFAGGFNSSSNQAIFRSTDNGSNWNEVFTISSFNPIRHMAVNGNNVFAGAAEGVLFSSDNGNSWANVNSSISVVSLATYGTRVFAGTDGGGIFSSPNNGISWSGASTGLGDPFVTSLLVSGTNIYAGTNSGGVFISDTTTVNWLAFNSGLGSLTVMSLAANSTNVFAGTGDGVWQQALAVGISPVSNASRQMTIYPNPGNGKFNIQSSIFKAPVSTTVYNLLGEKVFNTNLLSANSQIDLSAQSKGIYFLEIKSGEEIYMEKLIIE